MDQTSGASGTTFSSDAILVPGGGLTPAGTPHPWVVARLDRALDIHTASPILCLSGFSPHKPPLTDQHGLPVLEGNASARYLLRGGCDPTRILTECCSFDTIGNALFSRLLHAETRGWRRVLIVTSQFHLLRTRAIFETVYQLPNRHGERIACEFLGTPDEGLDELILSARREREKDSLSRWHSQVAESRWATLADFHEWLWTHHECHAAGLTPRRADGSVVRSY